MLGMFGGDKEGTTQSAIDLLKNDHDEVEKMFDEYEDRKDEMDAQTKEEIVESICKALEVHSQLEEELFYPAFRGVEDMSDLLDEATVEHASAKHLIALLEASTPDDMLYDARVQVLSEYVKHHVREEEGEIFPKARSSDVDLVELGRTMTSRKEELQQGAAVPAIEAELGRTSRGRRTSKMKAEPSHAAAKSASRKTTRKSTSRQGTARGGQTTSRKTTSRKTTSHGAQSRKTSSKPSTKRASARTR